MSGDGRYDIATLRRGLDYALTVTVNQIGSNSPLPLTGYTVRSQGRTRWEAADTLWDLDNAAKGGITTVPASGIITLALSRVQTAALPWNSGVWDLTLTDPAGKVTRLLWGLVEVDRLATR